MAYKLFDKNNNELTHHDLQHKQLWCKDGERIEETFIRLYGEKLELIINPDKKKNPYAPDLSNITNGGIADLKFQSTPFFKAKTLYNLDPTYTVVFNLKDKQRYEQHYPNIVIYYWVNWIAVKFQMGGCEIIVEPTMGVWKADFKKLTKYLNWCPLHTYLQRIDDNKGNAKESYLCDLKNEVFEKVL